jgi:hypothetical protein
MSRLGNHRLRSPSPWRVGLTLLACLAIVAPTGVSAGQLARPLAKLAAPTAVALPGSTQFDIDGFLQSATVTPGGEADAHSGGTLTVNGHHVTVPRETIVILPANALTWQELFAQAPAPYAGTNQTGLALGDNPKPPYTYEVHVVGNRQGDTYVAGLIDIAQQGLNSGAGYINYINYTTGEFRVGGTIGTENGQRVQLNDPSGRFGRIVTPDQRFTVDADNPTIAAATGFPMCIPRTDPASATPDALCPETNRPGDGTPGGHVIAIQMNNPVTNPGLPPDATRQAPFEVGDYVTYAGTMVNDPAPATTSYVSAHTVTNNAGIYTWPGTNPAYVSTEVTIIGTGGLTIVGATEATIRTRFEGMTTDPSRNVHLYGIDIDPATGLTTDRDWGTIGVDPGPPNGAVKGRWRFRPPCLVAGSIPTRPDKECVMNAAGVFQPATREVRAVIEGQQSQVTALNANDQTKTAANGLFYGQYHAPILEYLFPENIPGNPIVPNNFESMDFLACGGYTSAGGTRVGQLSPWPGAVAPSCGPVVPAVANAGGPYTVTSGGTVTLNGSAIGTAPVALLWAAPSQGTLSALDIGNPVYTAPVVDVQTIVDLSLTATNIVGPDTVLTTITVNPPAPVANAGPDQVVDSGALVTLAGSATGTAPTFLWTQAAIDPNQVLFADPTDPATTFTAPTGPAVLNLTLTASNAGGSNAASMTVTVNAPVAVPPVANAGGPYTVSSGGTVTFAGSATGSPTLAYLWATPTQGTISNRAIPTPVYTAPSVAVATVVNLSLTVSNGVGSPSTATTTVTVNAANAPTVAALTNRSVLSGTSGSFAVSGTDPNVPSQLPLKFVATQTGTPALTTLAVVNPTNLGATVNFTAPTLPLTQTTNSVITVSVRATNKANVVSAAQTMTITVRPFAAPTVNPITAISVPSGTTSSFAVSGADPNVPASTPLVFAATQSGTPALTTLTVTQGPLTPGTTATVKFKAPILPLTQTTNSVVTVSVRATNKAGKVSAARLVTITIRPAVAPRVVPVTAISVFSGAAKTLAITGTDPNVPASLPLRFTVTQTGTPALTNLLVTQGPNPPGTGATVSFRAPTLALGRVTPAVVTLTITTTNAAGRVSAPVSTTVTVKPLPDIVTITNATYRIGQQRLVLTATSSVISPNVVLTLRPYITRTGTLFTPPNGTFTNGGGGLYTITLVGVPEPAVPPDLPLTVRSNLGGLSAPHGLDRIQL